MRTLVSRAVLATAVTSLLGCATAPPLPPPVLPPERSSIDAVLAHRGELQLTNEQIDRLLTLDGEREQKLEALGLHPPRGTRPELPPVGSAMQRPSDMGPGGFGGRGMGGSGMGGMGGMGSGGMGGPGMGGRGMGGGRGPGGSAGGPDEQARREERQRAFDDADTAAFLSALEVLTPAQQEPAKGFASKFREALFDYRAAMKKLGDDAH